MFFFSTLKCKKIFDDDKTIQTFTITTKNMIITNYY